MKREYLVGLLKIAEILTILSGLAGASVLIHDYGQFTAEFENTLYICQQIFCSSMILTVILTFWLENRGGLDGGGDDGGENRGPFTDPPTDFGWEKKILNEVAEIAERKFRQGAYTRRR